MKNPFLLAGFPFYTHLPYKPLLVVLCLLGGVSGAFAQNNTQTMDRKGFLIGFGIGAGALHLQTNDTITNRFSTTIPNLKLGWVLNSKIAVEGLLTRASYRYQDKDRGFESLQLAVQYWPNEQWWLLAGTGVTFDLPAFYTLKKLDTTNFYTGLPSLSLAAGYELYHRGKFALDLQYRFFYGRSNLPDDGYRKGFSNMLIVGFNWY